MTDPRRTRALPDHGMLWAALALAVAMIGLFIGFGSPESAGPERVVDTHEVATDEATADQVPLAPRYRDLALQRRGANVHWTGGDLRTLPQEPPDDPDRLTLRQQRRAYAAAPPTIPHAIVQHSAENCLSCHAEGLVVGDRVASIPSHQTLTNCTQCHVTSAPHVPALAPGGLTVPNRFIGAEERPGERAWIGAPPQTPHPTHMRSNCMSCHGDLGVSPLRTSHPERTNCQQCHATAAQPGMFPLGAGGPPPAVTAEPSPATGPESQPPGSAER